MAKVIHIQRGLIFVQKMPSDKDSAFYVFTRLKWQSPHEKG